MSEYSDMNAGYRQEPKKATPRYGDWLQTYTGVQFWPLDAISDEVRLEDIAHSLSNLCRFAGHCRTFYSVAQHSIIVSEIVPPEFALQGLLHDAAEAYLVDLPRPVKHTPLLEGYRSAERRLYEVIAAHFGLPLEIAKPVRAADARVLASERRDLMPGIVLPDSENFEKPLDFVIIPMSFIRAEKEFLRRFEVLSGSR